MLYIFKSWYVYVDKMRIQTVHNQTKGKTNHYITVTPVDVSLAKEKSSE